MEGDRLFFIMDAVNDTSILDWILLIDAAPRVFVVWGLTKIPEVWASLVFTLTIVKIFQRCTWWKCEMVVGVVLEMLCRSPGNLTHASRRIMLLASYSNGHARKLRNDHL